MKYRLQRVRCLRYGCARIQPPDQSDRPGGSGPLGLARERRPDIRRLARFNSEEPRLGYPDNLENGVAYPDRTAHNLRIQIKSTLPESVADHCWRLARRAIVVSGNHAS